MEANKSSPMKHIVQTASGHISYTEQGTGPVALFVHGVLLNGYLWRHQLADLSDIRRCIARGPACPWRHRDRAGPGRVGNRQRQDAQAVSRCAEDRPGGSRRQRQRRRHRADLRCPHIPSAIRSLTLTDCDAHDNWPPEAFKPFLAMAAAGGLRGTLDAMLADKNVYRSPQALGPAYEHPDG